MSESKMRPEFQQAIQVYKQALAQARGQDYAENTSVEYAHGWFSVVTPNQSTWKYRLEQLETATRNLNNGHGTARSKTQKTVGHKTQKTVKLWDTISESFGKIADSATTHPFLATIVIPILLLLIVGFVISLVDQPQPRNTDSASGNDYSHRSSWSSESRGSSDTSQMLNSDSSPHSASRMSREEPSLTGSMNGYAWRKATDASKHALAADISKRLNENGTSDCSASFIYDALNTFFDSSNSAILKNKIADMVGLFVAAAKSLPENQRNY